MRKYLFTACSRYVVPTVKHAFAWLRVCSVFVLLLACSLSAFAQEEESVIIESIAHFQDPGSRLGFDEVRQQSFTPLEEPLVNLGFSNANEWIKLTIQNNSNAAANSLVRFAKPLVDSVSCFYMDEATKQQIHSGTLIPEKDKYYNGYAIYLPVTIPAGSSKDYYIRVSTPYGKEINLSVVNIQAYQDIERRNAVFIGLIIGSLLIITLYNLFLGFSIRDTLYLHYALANFGSIIAVCAMMGVYSKLLPPAWQHLVPCLSSSSIALFLVFSCNFCIRFLNLKQYSKQLFWGLIAIMAAQLMTMIVSNYQYYYLPGKHHYGLISFWSLFFTLFAFVAGVVALAKGHRAARFYLLGWGFLLSAVLLKTLATHGIFSNYFIANNAAYIGPVLEVLLLSFALADRYNNLQEEKIRLEHDLEHSQSDLSFVASDNRMRHLYRKNMLEEIEQILEAGDANMKQQLRSLQLELANQVETEHKLEMYEEHLDQVNSAFEARLKERFPDLTKSELEICGFIKLNLSIKEIASLRRTSEGAIKTARHRIKTKLQLDGERLDDFIRQEF